MQHKVLVLLFAVALLFVTPLHSDAASSKKSITCKSGFVVQGTKCVKKTVKKSSISSKSSKSSKSAASVACTIKGNISSNKEKIYHLIGCPNYNQTVIDTSKGEMMFCSETEALKAGWRKSLNCPK